MELMLKAWYNVLMLFFEFVSWWYGKGLVLFFNKIIRAIKSIWYKLSVPSLAKTLFSPWKRITSEYGKSAAEISRALVDNTVSRLIGFIIRTVVILVAIIGIVLILIIGIIILIIWPLAPLLIILIPIGTLL
jgi:hypothetical protein